VDDVVSLLVVVSGASLVVVEASKVVVLPEVVGVPSSVVVGAMGLVVAAVSEMVVSVVSSSPKISSLNTANTRTQATAITTKAARAIQSHFGFRRGGGAGAYV